MIGKNDTTSFVKGQLIGQAIKVHDDYKVKNIMLCDAIWIGKMGIRYYVTINSLIVHFIKGLGKPSSL